MTDFVSGVLSSLSQVLSDVLQCPSVYILVACAFILGLIAIFWRIINVRG